MEEQKNYKNKFSFIQKSLDGGEYSNATIEIVYAQNIIVSKDIF